MRAIRHWSLKTKLIMLSVVAVGVALAVSCVGVIFNEVRAMRAMKMEALRAQAQMLAFNSTGVLSFKDVPAAKQLLASLQSQPTVEFAVLYDERGRSLATYPDELHSAPPLPPAAVDSCRFTDAGFVDVVWRVMEHGEHLGDLYLRANAGDLHRQLAENLKIVVVMGFLALGGSVLIVLWLQEGISGPIVRLAQAAAQITALGDYSIRVERQSEDETGVLCTEFNRMLVRLHASDKALKKSHDELEDRVVERTAELCAEIAQRERVQAELLRAKEAAEAANVAKSRFLANMSHEIRTPLNAVIGFTDLLRKSGDQCDEAEREEYLETIHTSGKHLLDLINDILDLSKIEAEHLDVEQVRCSPHDVISEVVSVLRVKALEKGLSLDCHWRSGVPETICTDPARFRQLLINLVGNAIKFTAVGGVQIQAALAQDPLAPQLTVEVIDTGVGIPADKFGDIFDPFVQADTSVTRQFGGTGLGLTISRRIAQALGGGLAVASEVGKGSTFTVTIATGPLDNVMILDAPVADGLRNVRAHEQEALPSLAGANILLVEDGDTNRRLIGLVLERAGAQVTMAENGRIGVDLGMKTPFDLLLMDMQMPVMDGYAATAQLRQRGVTAPIIALTAHAMKGDENKCRVAGCSGYVTKPIDADLLIRTIAEMLGDRLGNPIQVASRPVQEAGTSEIAAARTAPVPSSVPAGALQGASLFSTLPTDDPDFRAIVVEFIERLHEQWVAMQRALNNRDFHELASLAHWLKGSGGTAGFAVFTPLAKRLESFVQDRRCEAIEAALAEVAHLAQRLAVSDAARVSAREQA